MNRPHPASNLRQLPARGQPKRRELAGSGSPGRGGKNRSFRGRLAPMRGCFWGMAALLLSAMIGGACVRRPPASAWPQAQSHTAVFADTPAVSQGKVLRVAFVQDVPDNGRSEDTILVAFDRPVDPLSISAQRFSLVGADRRVLIIERAYLQDDDAQPRRVVLRGRFGDGPTTWASSLALLPGVFGADGAPVATAKALTIKAPPKEPKP